MSKAILIIPHMPTRCADCPLRNDAFWGIDKSVVCQYTLNDISNDNWYKQKPDWCPLQELPEKKEMQFLDDISEYYRQGYNTCLNKIVKNSPTL